MVGPLGIEPRPVGLQPTVLTKLHHSPTLQILFIQQLYVFVQTFFQPNWVKT